MKLGYARVSRNDQDLSLQTAALEKAGVEQIFSDKISGAEHDRDGLNELLKLARKGDTVIVWRLDRLARSLTHLIELAADFEKRNIQLRSLTENIDTSTAAGKLFFNIFAAIAEFERNLIIERTTAGLDAARAKGRLLGRNPALDSKKKKAIDEIVQNAQRDGRPYSTTEIGFAIGVSERTVRRYIAGVYTDKQKRRPAKSRQQGATA